MTAPSKTASPLRAIGEVAEATGLTPETLRIWERRYGRPKAVRLPSGHRRYTDAQIVWLRRVAEALAHGHRPNKVLRLAEKDLDALLLEHEEGPDKEVRRLLEWASDFRGVEIRAALESWWDPERPIEFLAQRVSRFLYHVGREWADGRLDIRHEHFVSEIVQDTLRRFRDSYPRRGDRGGVLLTTLSGETHGLGMQMAALMCAAIGMPCHVLGVDSPNEEIAGAAEHLEAVVVGVSISLDTGGVETDRTLAALRGLLPDDVRLIVGGEGARRARRGPRGVLYVESLEDWVEALRQVTDAA